MSPTSIPWQVESIRLTGIFGNVFTKMPDWKSITGSDPEVSNSQPKLKNLLEVGEYKGETLALTVNPNRFDIVIMPNQQKTASTTLGDYPDSANEYIRDLIPYFQKQENMIRVALGLVLVHEVKDRISGYQEIQTLLHEVNLDPINSSDFTYTINRPINSKTISGMKINRLSKWMVRQFANASMAIMSDYTTVGNPNIVSVEYATRLELDLSTSQDNLTSLTSDKISELINEMFRLSSGIAIEGDKA